jgi:signal transduction histidine kinase
VVVRVAAEPFKSRGGGTTNRQGRQGCWRGRYPDRKHVSLDVVLDPRLPPFFADRVQLQQLVLNLMVNALEALEPVSGRPKQLSIRSKRAEPGHAVIQISDNGIGLDDPVAAFEPFVTTKPEGWASGWRSAGRSSRLMRAGCLLSATQALA